MPFRTRVRLCLTENMTGHLSRQKKTPMSHSSDTQHPRIEDESTRRWFSIEWLGLLSGGGFFIGLFFAYHTFASGLMTQAEFASLTRGMSITEVNTCLGFDGTLVESTMSDAHSQNTVYRWENSSLSWVEARFCNGRLANWDCRNLP